MPPQNQHSDKTGFCAAIDRIRQQARQRNRRALLVLSGDQQWCEASASLIVSSTADNIFEWVGKGQDAQQTQKQHFSAKLGREVDVLIFPLTPGFDANRLTALSGMIRGGGLLVLLLTNDLWNSASHFDRRFIDALHRPGIEWLIQNKAMMPDDVATDKEYHSSDSRLHVTDKLYLNDQNDVVNSLVQLCQAGDKAMAVIQSDRGRGKSAALGIAAAKWLQAGEDVYVTGPSLKSVAQVLYHAQQALPEAELHRGSVSYQRHRLTFLPPDAVHSEYQTIQRLLVDEAAAIPIPKLSAWLQHIPQMIFATTIHGYEGTGKGFLLKFTKILQQQRPGWQRLSLQQPIRWASDDFLEQWLNQTFLLDAEIESLTPEFISTIDPNSLTTPAIGKTLAAEFIDSGFERDEELHTAVAEGIVIEQYNSYDLYSDEHLLQKIYGLLINAHYRTTPKDLRYLLDTDSAAVYTLRYKQQLLAAAWVMYEGEFEQELSDAVYLGTRRPTGHLLAQSLTYHCALQDAATYRYARIVRIAVHPQCQRQGLGSQLLQHIIKAEAEVDAVGSSFSATPEGLDFWQRNAFIPVRIGMTRHQSSGEHSVMLLHPVSETGQAITKKSRNRMLNALSYHLKEPLVDLDKELVMRLVETEVTINRELSADDWQELVLFAYANRTYAEALGPLVKLASFVTNDESTLSGMQEQVMVEKVLQHKSWDEVVANSGLEGQKQAVQILRESVQILLQLFGPEELKGRIDWVKQMMRSQ